jgi:hypothetical protein
LIVAEGAFLQKDESNLSHTLRNENGEPIKDNGAIVKKRVVPQIDLNESHDEIFINEHNMLEDESI